MDLMGVRRRLMMGKKKLVDTSPKIVEYGKACDYATTGERPSTGQCYTQWYAFEPNTVKVKLYYFINGKTQRPRNYQYYAERPSDGNIIRDWFYNSSQDTIYRTIGWNGYYLKEIRFTIDIEDLDVVYAYCEETGQIFFAGKNSPYYGYTNINDMP